MAAALTPAVLVAGYYRGLGWLLGGAIGFSTGGVLAALAVWGVPPALDRHGAARPSSGLARSGSDQAGVGADARGTRG